MASRTVKNFALLVAMSATASAGVNDWYLSRLTYLFKCDKSTHMWMRSEFFLGVTTMGAHQSVTSVTGVMMFCACSRSSSAASLSQYANGMDLGVVMQNGFASCVRCM